jgi:hypothetical protein
VFRTWLFEAQGSPSRHRVYYRFERTERPEELRSANLFRSLRPHLDDQNLGTTRWTVHTVGYGLSLAPQGTAFELRPFAEAASTRASRVTGAFDPALFYGRSRIISLSVGLRIAWRMAGHRMGRYHNGTVHGRTMEEPHRH